MSVFGSLNFSISSVFLERQPGKSKTSKPSALLSFGNGKENSRAAKVNEAKEMVFFISLPSFTITTSTLLHGSSLSLKTFFKTPISSKVPSSRRRKSFSLALGSSIKQFKGTYTELAPSNSKSCFPNSVNKVVKASNSFHRIENIFARPAKFSLDTNFLHSDQK